MKTKVKADFYAHFDLLYMQFSKAKINKDRKLASVAAPTDSIEKIIWAHSDLHQ